MAYGYVTFAPTFALATRESIGRTRPAMDGLASTDSCGDAISHWWRGPAANKVLLMAGVAAVVVYAVGDVLSGLLYDGYSHTDQAISELSAFGSPVRPLMVTAILTHGVLLLAFGLGVLRAACRKRVWWIGALLVAIGVLGLPTHTVWEAGRRDVSFIRGVDRSLQVVTNGQRAMVVLWSREGFDEGIYAVDPSASDNSHDGFILENGQADSYAGNETVPLDQALEAVRYAIDHDEPDPRLQWLRW